MAAVGHQSTTNEFAFCRAHDILIFISFFDDDVAPATFLNPTADGGPLPTPTPGRTEQGFGCPHVDGRVGRQDEDTGIIGSSYPTGFTGHLAPRRFR